MPALKTQLAANPPHFGVNRCKMEIRIGIVLSSGSVLCRRQQVLIPLIVRPGTCRWNPSIADSINPNKFTASRTHSFGATVIPWPKRPRLACMRFANVVSKYDFVIFLCPAKKLSSQWKVVTPANLLKRGTREQIFPCSNRNCYSFGSHSLCTQFLPRSSSCAA